MRSRTVESLFFLILGSLFGLLLVIGAVAQYQKRRQSRFYVNPTGTDVPYGGPEPPVEPNSFPLHHP